MSQSNILYLHYSLFLGKNLSPLRAHHIAKWTNLRKQIGSVSSAIPTIRNSFYMRSDIYVTFSIITKDY